MSEEQSKQLMEILSPLFEKYTEIRINKENDKLMIYGVNYKEMCDIKFGDEDNG